MTTPIDIPFDSIGLVPDGPHSETFVVPPDEGRLCRQVREFHRAMGQPTASAPCALDVERVRLRLSLIIEEVTELAAALGSDGTVLSLLEATQALLAHDDFSEPLNLVAAADAMGDTQYVVAGTAVEMGIALEAVTDEIHRSNMTKAGGEVRADGKVLKGKNYKPPRLEPILFGGAA